MKLGASEGAAGSVSIRQTLAGAFSLTALAAILVWSGVAPFGKYALEDFPTLAYVALRPMMAAAAIFAVLSLRGQRRWSGDRTGSASPLPGRSALACRSCCSSAGWREPVSRT